MLFYSPKPDSFLDGYILRFFLILIAMLHLLGNPPIPGNSSFDEATLRHLLFFIQKCSCDFLCELKFFHFRSYFPVFAIPFFFLFQHFCPFPRIDGWRPSLYSYPRSFDIFAAIGFFFILRIIRSISKTLGHCFSFAYMQCNQSCCCHDCSSHSFKSQYIFIDSSL